ncbi:hypothetical protein WJX77_003617 [Trebouxia sp. C0004]
MTALVTEGQGKDPTFNTASQEDEDALQQQASQVVPLEAENKKLRDKLAAAEKRLENMTALMRSANPLTPFDFPTVSASVLSTVAAYPASNETRAAQCSQAAMQPIPAMQLAQFTDVEMVVSRGALGGWVEQASPACGAASVAGAWNAVKPAEAASASKEDVLELYANKWQHSIAQSCSSLAELLQVSDAVPLQKAIEAAWPFADQTWVEGEPVVGKAVKPLKPTKVAALQLLQHLATEHDHYTIPTAAVEYPAQSGQPMQPGAADQMGITALLAQLPQPAATGSTPTSAESDAEAEEKKVAQKLAGLTVTLLARMRGLWNLTKQRPSTAPVGNDALMAALRQLGSDWGEDLAVWKFMSAGKQRAQYQVSKLDSSDAIQEQWQGVVGIVQDSRSALMYHMENHYCLAFAARSWRMDAGYSGCKQVRQLLVARPGQKPCAWVSFDSLRSSLLSWHGYALMAVTHRQDALLVQSPPK